MRESFFGGRPLEWVDFKEPSDEVDEVLVVALETLFERCLLRDQDVDLHVVLVQ